jgi:penicillin amidase
MSFLSRRLGRNKRRWSWGRLHRHVFRHPLSVSPLRARLLNPESLPASGDSTTVNVAWCMPGLGNYDVTANPSMRMIVTLGDPDGMLIIGPLGQSGQPGHPHYDDMSTLWAKGCYLPLPMGRKAVEALAKERLTLRR